MQKRTIQSAALALAVVGTVAWTQLNPPLRVQPASTLAVTGTSTMRGFECKAKSFDATVESTTPDAVTSVLAGVKSVGAVELKVPVDQMDCGNGTMNEHMRKALKASEFSTITFTVDDYELAKSDSVTRVRLNGSLTLGGIRKQIVVEARATPADGALLVRGAYELNMKEYGLKPPSLMLGTMKVGEKVNVKFELLLKP